LQRDSHGSVAYKNCFVVVEETAELLAATVAFPQPVNAAGRGSQEILAECHFMASEADIDARRRARVCFHPEQHFSAHTVPVHAQNLAQGFLREIGHGIKEKRTV